MTIAGVVLLGMQSPNLVTLGYGTGALPPPPPPVIPAIIRGGAPVWWRGEEYEEEEKPEVVNEIGVVPPDEVDDAITEEEVLARARPLSEFTYEPNYANVAPRVIRSLAVDIVRMRAERREEREISEYIEKETKKRMKRLREEEEILLLS